MIRSTLSRCRTRSWHRLGLASWLTLAATSTHAGTELPVYVGEWCPHGSGPGECNTSRGIAVDPQGNVFVADTRNHRIEKFDSEGRFLSQWGRRGAEPGNFDYPTGVATDGSGAVYVVDADNHRIQKFTNDGQFMKLWSTRQGDLDAPFAIAIDRMGHVFVSQGYDELRIQVYSLEGAFLGAWGQSGAEPGHIYSPTRSPPTRRATSTSRIRAARS
jgi:DNA-binding beta-propeller fold protein YncE